MFKIEKFIYDLNPRKGMKELKPGMKHELTVEVTPDMTASKFVKGTPNVFATAAMVALIEQTCKDMTQPYLERGQTTVGTRINASHIAATPVGMRVTARAELIEIDRRRLEFRVEVFDEVEKISDAEHTRFIINIARFEEKTMKKLERVR